MKVYKFESYSFFYIVTEESMVCAINIDKNVFTGLVIKEIYDMAIKRELGNLLIDDSHN
jgi:hypothetical protein